MPVRSKPKTSARAAYLKRKYGIDEKIYRTLLEGQGGVCVICEKSPTQEGKNLAVDHDHHTGEIRGLLCAYCNHRRIGRHRDPHLLRRMADYLERHTGYFVPAKPKRKTRRRK